MHLMAAAAGEEERTTDADKRGFPVIRASSNCSSMAHMVIGMRIKDIWSVLNFSCDDGRDDALCVLHLNENTYHLVYLDNIHRNHRQPFER